MAAGPTHPIDSARQLFGWLQSLGRLRIISQSGPSTFEALCEVGPHGFAGGYMNAITDAYHWHLKLDGLGHVRTQDKIHGRSGRRVLFLELRERAEAPPFLMIYLHREKGADFDPELEKRFLEGHAHLAQGRQLAQADPEGDAQ